MANLAESLKPIVFKLRGIAGKLGMRPFTIKLVKRTYAGKSWDGESFTDEVIQDIREGDNQSPKVKFLTYRDYAAGYPQDAEIEVGPITPYTITADGYVGTNIPEPDSSGEIFFIIDGLGFSNTRFQRVQLKTERTLGFYLVLKRISDSE